MLKHASVSSCVSEGNTFKFDSFLISNQFESLALCAFYVFMFLLYSSSDIITPFKPESETQNSMYFKPFLISYIGTK